MDKGYFYIPFEYISNPELTSDLWVVQPGDPTPAETTNESVQQTTPSFAEPAPVQGYRCTIQ